MVFEAFNNSLVQVYIDSKAFGSTNLHDRSALHCAVLGGRVVKYLTRFYTTPASSRSPATTNLPLPRPILLVDETQSRIDAHRRPVAGPEQTLPPLRHRAQLRPLHLLPRNAHPGHADPSATAAVARPSTSPS